MKTQKDNRMIKAIKIFEPGGKINQDNEEILDDVSDGVILVNENNKFEGVLYKKDNALYITGYLGKDVISIDMPCNSVNAILQKDGTFLGVEDSEIDEDLEITCRVIVSNLKEDKTFEEDRLFKVIYLLKNDKVMVLERNLQK